MADITEQLVHLVVTCPCLYDIKHADYKNVVKKAEMWMEIAGVHNNSGK